MNVKWYSQLWKTVWWFLKQLNTELPYDPAIPSLGTHPKELKAGTQIFSHQCSQQHYSQQPKGGNNPNEWRNKMWCIYNGILFNLKKE